MIEKINAGNREISRWRESSPEQAPYTNPHLPTLLPLYLLTPAYRDQVGSVTLPRPLTTGIDLPVGTSNREMVLPVL